MRIAELHDEDAILEVFATVRELRPHLDAKGFVARVRQQRQQGYRLVALRTEGDGVAAVAGFRLGDNLAWGRHLYVDDLVTAERHRSKGYARALLDWLEGEARRLNCAALHLDSGTGRHDAHRLYLGAGFDISSFHFRKALRP